MDETLMYMGTISRSAGRLSRLTWFGQLAYSVDGQPRMNAMYDEGADGEPETIVYDPLVSENGIVIGQRMGIVSVGLKRNRMLWACSFRRELADGLQFTEWQDGDNDGNRELIVFKVGHSTGERRVLAMYEWDERAECYVSSTVESMNDVLVWCPAREGQIDFCNERSVDSVLDQVIGSSLE